MSKTHLAPEDQDIRRYIKL